MKLFTKEIDNKLFAQYSKGGDLEKQKVITKIFNPYGKGRWYLLNSDPEDPDYLWAIVEMGGEVEIGSVSRSQLENIKIGPYRFPLERDIYFSPKSANEIYSGLKEGKYFKDGGEVDIAEQNKDMLLNYAEELEHHTEEFEEAAKKAEKVEPWVVAKIERATTDLSDVTHYLDSENEKRREHKNGEGEEKEYEEGGEVEGVDLFEDYQNIPPKVQKVLEKYSDAFEGGDYRDLERANAALKKIGYTFEYGLDGEAYDLRKIGEKGKSESYEKGGLITESDVKVGAKFKNKSGTIFIVDEVKEYDLGGKKSTYVNSSIEGGSKGNYRNRIDDFVDFMNEEEVAKYAKGGETDSYLHLYKLTYPDGRIRVRKYEGEYMSPSEAMKKMYISLDGLQSYRYVGASSSSPNYKKWHLLKSKGNTDEQAYQELFEDTSMENGGMMANGGRIKANYIVTFAFYDDDGEYRVVKSKPIYADSEDDAAQKLQDQFENYEGIGVEIINVNKSMASGGMMARGGEITVKVGDKVKSKSGIDGEVYESTGTFFKLQDKYGNKGSKFYSTRDFKRSEIKSMASGGMMADGGMLGSVEEIKDISDAITEETGLEKNDGPEYGFVTRLDVERILGKEKYKLLKYKGTFAKNFDNQIPLFEEIINDLNNYGWNIIDTRKQKMASGGKVKFADKVKSIKSSLLKRKKVSPSVQKDYGKTYSPKEAEESAKRIVGAMTAKERLMKKRKK